MTMLDSTVRGMIVACARNPGCDVTRMAYADALRESGDDVMADFVSAQLDTTSVVARPEIGLTSHINGSPASVSATEVSGWYFLPSGPDDWHLRPSRTVDWTVVEVPSGRKWGGCGEVSEWRVEANWCWLRLRPLTLPRHDAERARRKVLLEKEKALFPDVAHRFAFSHLHPSIDDRFHRGTASLSVRRGLPYEARLPIGDFLGRECRTCRGSAKVHVCRHCKCAWAEHVAGAAKSWHLAGPTEHPCRLCDNGLNPVLDVHPCPGCAPMSGKEPGIVADLFRKWPCVERVVFSDRRPSEGGSDSVSWEHYNPLDGNVMEHPDVLPSRLYDRMKRVKPKPYQRFGRTARYRSTKDATDALSAAAVLLGNELAAKEAA